MPTRKLPDNPSLENLKKQAKTLLKTVTAREPESLRLLEEFHPRGTAATEEFALNDAQLDLIAEDDRRNVYAGELEVRPRAAPTTGRLLTTIQRRP